MTRDLVGRALLLLITLLALPADAAVRRIVDVRYQRTDGTRSRPVPVEVNFTTGAELNEKTNSFRYRMFSNYGLIWFDQDEVAIIELQGVLPVSGPFSNDDFKNMFFIGQEISGRQVNSESPRRWYFQAKRMFQWIDPRVENE